MRIVFLRHSLALKGGLERSLIDRMNFLSDNGHEVYIITYDQGNHPMPFFISPNVTHIDLGIFLYRQYNLGLLYRIIYYFKKNIELRKKYKKYIIQINPHITVTTTYSYLEIRMVMKFKYNSKTIIESHSFREAIKETFLLKKGNFIHKIAATYIDKKRDKLIANSSALITLTDHDSIMWNDIKKSTLIPNLLTYYPQKLINITSKKQVISVGRLAEQKGYDLLIEAWSLVHDQNPEWKLVIFGEGEEKGVILDKIDTYNLNEIIEIHPPTDQIYEKYMESDFYVMSSRWEGFGLVLIEAMSCGIPCISFDCPSGPSDIIKDGVDGLLVDNGNIKQLAEKICYLINNEKIRCEMGLKARENVKKYFPENIMPKWESLFYSLINKI